MSLPRWVFFLSLKPHPSITATVRIQSNSLSLCAVYFVKTLTQQYCFGHRLLARPCSLQWCHSEYWKPIWCLIWLSSASFEEELTDLFNLSQIYPQLNLASSLVVWMNRVKGLPSCTHPQLLLVCMWKRFQLSHLSIFQHAGFQGWKFTQLLLWILLVQLIFLLSNVALSMLVLQTCSFFIFFNLTKKYSSSEGSSSDQQKYTDTIYGHDIC